jgi:hypothetical protein
MSILRHIKRLQYIDFLIRRKSTGDLSTFSRKNKLSKRGLLNVLQDMREMGFPIRYDKRNSTYIYEEKGQMVKTLFIPEGHHLSHEDAKKIGVNNVNELCFSEVTIFELCEK